VATSGGAAAGTAVASSLGTTEDDMSIEKQIESLERRYWQALKDQDKEAAIRLTDDPCIVTGAQGVSSLDRATFEKMMSAEQSYALVDFRLDDVKVRSLSDDVAICAYKVHETLEVDGQSIELEANESSTWVRRGGGWVCALHSEAIAGDPFGRDRRPSAGSA
jgi:ketosteroid isomerase-like protein